MKTSSSLITSLFLSSFAVALWAHPINDSNESLYKCLYLSTKGDINGPTGIVRMLWPSNVAFTGGSISYKELQGSGSSTEFNFTGECRKDELIQCSLTAVGEKVVILTLSSEPQHTKMDFIYSEKDQKGRLRFEAIDKLGLEVELEAAPDSECQQLSNFMVAQ